MQIDIRNLSFAYDGSDTFIFKDLSLKLDTDWKLGLIGRNGYGKTTFLNILQGKYQYSGKIVTSVSFDYFPFEIQDKTRITIDIVKSLHDEFEPWRFYREAAWLKINETVFARPFNTLSWGEQTKILLASLFIKDNNFLLIDEPTNHLDSIGRKIVSQYLKHKKGFILVSHDRRFLDTIIDHVLTIEKRKVVLQKGNYTTWETSKYKQDVYEINRNDNLRKEIKRLEQSAEEKMQWVRTSTHPHIHAVKARQLYRYAHKAIEEKKTLLQNREEISIPDYSPLHYTETEIVSVSDLAPYYGERRICAPISFSIHDGKRIALKGKNGSGKSSICKILTGDAIAYTGFFHFAPSVIVSYIPLSADFLSGSLDAFVETYQLNSTDFFTVLETLGFFIADCRQPIESYSAGQKKKLLIAKSLCEKAHLYIWDEPLNYIDVITRLQLEKMILMFQPTMLIVEHDELFTERIATDTVYFE